MRASETSVENNSLQNALITLASQRFMRASDGFGVTEARVQQALFAENNVKAMILQNALIPLASLVSCVLLKPQQQLTDNG